MTLLPIVKHETLESSLRSLAEGGEEWIVGNYETIKKEQPVLWDMVETLCSAEDLTEEFQNGYLRGASQFYGLLRRQAEADEMKFIWNLGDTEDDDDLS